MRLLSKLQGSLPHGLHASWFLTMPLKNSGIRYEALLNPFLLCMPLCRRFLKRYYVHFLTFMPFSRSIRQTKQGWRMNHPQTYAIMPVPLTMTLACCLNFAKRLQRKLMEKQKKLNLLFNFALVTKKMKISNPTKQWSFPLSQGPTSGINQTPRGKRAIAYYLTRRWATQNLLFSFLVKEEMLP